MPREQLVAAKKKAEYAHTHRKNYTDVALWRQTLTAWEAARDALAAYDKEHPHG